MIRLSDLPKRFCANKGRSSHARAHAHAVLAATNITRARGAATLTLALRQRARVGDGRLLLQQQQLRAQRPALALLHSSPRAAKPPPSVAVEEDDHHLDHLSTKSHAAAGLQEGSLESWEENVREEERAWLTGPRPRDWWTGPIPESGNACPGLLPDGSMTSLPLPHLRTATREDLLAYFDNSWALTEALFAGLQGPEAFYQPPYHQLRHPLMFYYGHPAVLYVNKMRVAGLLDGPIHAAFESLFETGVDEMAWDDLSKNHKAWPSAKEVRDYRQQVYDTVKRTIQTHPAFPSLAADIEQSPFWSVVMGCEHERIHLETSSVLFRELPLRRVQPPPQWPRPHPATFAKRSPLSRPVAGVDYPAHAMTPIPGGPVTLGKPRGFPSFGWDNEYGRKAMEVKAFQAGKYQVTNGQFYQFVAEGGYFDRANWSKDGWGWRCFRNVRHPPFWVPTGPSGLQAYRLRAVFEEVDMPWACPVEVNYHEAKAFAAWLSRKEGGSASAPSQPQYRLTTEAEHHLLRDPPSTAGANAEEGEDDAVLRHSGEGMRGRRNVNLAYGMTSPVDAFPPTQRGVHDAFGNAWEWQEDHFSPLPGFKTHAHYADFSLPCFDGRHHLIMGGSYASTGDEASRFARFHFRPHFHQHAGFRLARPNPEDPTLHTSCMDNQGPFAGAENPFRSSSSSSSAQAPLDAAGQKASFNANKAQYEDQEWLQRYLHLHYPDLNDSEACPRFLPKEVLDFPKRCADRLIAAAARVGAPTGRALDLGCAVGGSTFALARAYGEVHGLELSEAFVDAAKALQASGAVSYAIKAEGDGVLPLTARLPTGVDPSRVTFAVGDALALPSELGGRPTRHAFDAVLMANVLCRLPDPKAALEGIAGEERGVIAPGGLFLLTTPFSWKPEFTPRDRWLGGAVLEEGQDPKSSLEELKAFMPTLGYDLLESEDMPLAIRQHRRLYELIGAHATLWQRRK